jgi:hypothetical protein
MNSSIGSALDGEHFYGLGAALDLPWTAGVAEGSAGLPRGEEIAAHEDRLVEFAGEGFETEGEVDGIAKEGELACADGAIGDWPEMDGGTGLEAQVDPGEGFMMTALDLPGHPLDGREEDRNGRST